MKNFDCKDVSTSIYGLNEFLGTTGLDIDDNSPKARVQFDLLVDRRSCGLDGISPSVTRVLCDIEWTIYEDELTELEKEQVVKAGGFLMRNGYYEGAFRIDTNMPDHSWTVIDKNFIVKEGGYVTPDEVEINFKNFTIEIS